MSIYQRDSRGWRLKTRFCTFHPVSYGVGSLARLSFGLHPEGRRLMLHYFPPGETPPHRWHDHPWSFTTVVLWGGYTDESIHMGPDDYVRERDRLRIGSVRRRPASHRHRTYVPRRTITLVFRGRTERTWCEGSTVDWKCDGDPADFDATLGRRVP